MNEMTHQQMSVCIFHPCHSLPFLSLKYHSNKMNTCWMNKGEVEQISTYKLHLRGECILIILEILPKFKIRNRVLTH